MDSEAQLSGRSEPAANYEDTSNQNLPPVVATSSDLPEAMGGLTMNEVEGSPKYSVASNYSTAISSQSASSNVPHTSPFVYQPLSTPTVGQPAVSYGTYETTQNTWSPQTNTLQGTPSLSYGPSARSLAPMQNQTPQSPGPRHIVGTVGEYDELDRSYRQRNYDYKKFFCQGRVFGTLWTDAYSEKTNEEPSFTGQSVYYVRFGQRVHSKIRRFIVVKQGLRSCTCLPITTYDGKGVSKRYVNPDEHTQVYTGRDPPKKPPEIAKAPLKVILSKGVDPKKDKITNSYVDFGRPYTVESNVKVKDFGELDQTSRRLLRRYYNEINTLAEYSDDPDRTLPAADDTLLGVGEGVGEVPLHSSPSMTSAQPYISPVNYGESSGPSTGGYAVDYSQSYNTNPAASAHSAQPLLDLRSTPTSSSHPSTGGYPIQSAAAPETSNAEQVSTEHEADYTTRTSAPDPADFSQPASGGHYPASNYQDTRYTPAPQISAYSTYQPVSSASQYSSGGADSGSGTYNPESSHDGHEPSSSSRRPSATERYEGGDEGEGADKDEEDIDLDALRPSKSRDGNKQESSRSGGRSKHRDKGKGKGRGGRTWF